MKEAVIKKESCRLCNSAKILLVVNINPSPIADAYVSKNQLDETQDLYPLDLYLCEDCGHIQNAYVVNPDLLFKNYTFFTSNFKGLVEHFKEYADDITRSFDFKEGDLAVEIGSNDGTFLLNLKEKGMKVLGVDPAIDAVNFANEKGAHTLPDYFTEELAQKIVAENGKATLVIANNVFAHSDNLIDIINGIEKLLDKNGIFIFEVSYLADIIDRFLFDTVYHEHVSYHSINPLQKAFARKGLEIFDIIRNKSKGGSIRCFVKRISSEKHTAQPVVQEYIQNELQRGLNKKEVFLKYNQDVLQKKKEVLTLIDQLLVEGKKIVGYGASTTVTTLMWHFELTERLMFLVDDNKIKQYLFSPNNHLEVLPSSELVNSNIDYVVIMAWNYAEPIMANNKAFADKGGKFIIPLPELKVV
jgi:SAM-dependent methyltransferase